MAVERRLVLQGRVRPASVVVPQERRQPGGARFAVGPDSAIGSLAQTSLDDPLRLAIGLGQVGTREHVLDSQGSHDFPNSRER